MQILEALDSLEEFKISHVYREGNGDADQLSKEAIHVDDEHGGAPMLCNIALMQVVGEATPRNDGGLNFAVKEGN